MKPLQHIRQCKTQCSSSICIENPLEISTNYWFYYSFHCLLDLFIRFIVDSSSSYFTLSTRLHLPRNFFSNCFFFFLLALPLCYCACFYYKNMFICFQLLLLSLKYSSINAMPQLNIEAQFKIFKAATHTQTHI